MTALDHSIYGPSFFICFLSQPHGATWKVILRLGTRWDQHADASQLHIWIQMWLQASKKVPKSRNELNENDTMQLNQVKTGLCWHMAQLTRCDIFVNLFCSRLQVHRTASGHLLATLGSSFINWLARRHQLPGRHQQHLQVVCCICPVFPGKTRSRESYHT